MNQEISSLKAQLSKTTEDLKRALADQKAQNLALEKEVVQLRTESHDMKDLRIRLEEVEEEKRVLLQNLAAVGGRLPPAREDSSLISSAIRGDLNTLRRHLDQAGQKDSSGMTALMHAASRGQTEVVRLPRPLEAHLQDGRGWTALMHAVGGGHEECVGLLLLERDLRDGEGRTAEDVANGLPDGERRRITPLLRRKVHLPDLPDELSSFQLTGRLGRGAFGTVFSAWSEEHGNSALKVVEYEEMERTIVDSLRREMGTIPSLEHPHVLRYHRVHDDPDNGTAYLVMDWCSGTLLDEVRGRGERGEPFRDDEVWRCLREMASGLAYLHERGLVHRDLKPGNIFLAPNGRLVLADFGLVRDAARSRQMSTVAGTELYMAPELYDPEPQYSFPVDVWALGVMGYEMCTGKFPFSTVPAILEKDPPAIENRDGGLVTLISRMLSRNPKDRPTARDVLKETEREDDTTPDSRTFPSLPESMKQHYSLKTSFEGRPNTFKAVDSMNKPCMIEVVPHPEGPSLLNSPTELKDLRHQNVLEYSCVIDDGKGRVFIVTAWHPSTLQDAMTRRLGNGEIKQHLRQLALGLEYLHGKGIVLRSICPKSVLLSDDGECILGGLDCASFISDAPCKPVGEPLRRPPEMQQGRTSYRPSADIWALGLLAYELCTGRLPFTTEEQVARMDAPPPEERDQDLVTLVLRMLEKNPERRPTAQEVVRTLRRR
ncbi:Kinase, NEK [Giardia muris]|uniref:non-specific serine/threonine protein kinase n=1 Tax=Giardia muris TaxID=5742 RepID=A0A4Z1T5T1_GIAMU|nr:Kinase, NEK [Giardia muris]|eukprot:TNJ29413.1 Kinase, NEK [Giardia muris]